MGRIHKRNDPRAPKILIDQSVACGMWHVACGTRGMWWQVAATHAQAHHRCKCSAKAERSRSEIGLKTGLRSQTQRSGEQASGVGVVE